MWSAHSFRGSQDFVAELRRRGDNLEAVAEQLERLKDRGYFIVLAVAVDALQGMTLSDENALARAAIKALAVQDICRRQKCIADLLERLRGATEKPFAAQEQLREDAGIALYLLQQASGGSRTEVQALARLKEALENLPAADRPQWPVVLCC